MAPTRADTILRLANRGNVILIGRGAHVITRNLNNVSHCAWSVRFRSGPNISSNFEALADRPLSYNLVINTDAVPHERAARLIAEAGLAAVQHKHPPERAA